MAVKLVQAAALAAALVPLGALPADAGPITCGFGGSGPSCDSADAWFVGGGEGPPTGNAVFRWPGETYTLTLDFEFVRGEFTITVDNEEISQAAMASSGRLGPFGNDLCVPIDEGLGLCVVFHFSSTDGGTAPGFGTTPGDDTWEGDWVARINWLPDTNAGYPGSTVRVRHERGDDPDDVFDTDITVPGSYCATDCVPPILVDGPSGFGPLFSYPLGTDPEIAGTADSFSSVMATSEVPEPATVLLLGTGLIGLWCRWRSARRS